MSDTSTYLAMASQPFGVAAPVGLQDQDALPACTRVEEFEIVRVLGAGGFGMVYLALDQVLLRYVAVKEYMPTALTGRRNGALVSPRSAALAETFAVGLESFIDEARLLASFDHPSLVKVHRFWKANGTAYMAMPYYPGQTLKETRRGMSAAPGEAWLRALVEPLLGALEVLHAQGVYHRDIAPDNILLLPDGRPILLDFGSARRVIGDRTQSLTAMLKPNFAPVEQYADDASMRQGPWTDLYALGATVHFMLTGVAPTPAALRAVRDVLPALSALADTPGSGVPQHFLAAIDWALALAPQDRPQSVQSMRQALNGEVVPPAPSMRVTTAPRHPTPEFNRFEEEDGFGATIAVSEPPPVPHFEMGRMSLATVAKLVPNLGRRSRAGLTLLALTGLCALGAWALGPSSALPDGAPSDTTEIALSAASPSKIVTSAEALSAADGRLPQLPVAIVAPASLPQVAALHTAARPGPSSRVTKVVVAHVAKPLAFRRDPSSAPVAAREQPPSEAAPARANPVAAAAPRSPKEICGDLNFFAMAMCVSRECQTPQFGSHPQCVEMRRAEEQRQRRMEQ